MEDFIGSQITHLAQFLLYLLDDQKCRVARHAFRQTHGEIRDSHLEQLYVKGNWKMVISGLLYYCTFSFAVFFSYMVPGVVSNE